MSSRIDQSASVAIISLSAVSVLAIGLYMAQPWGDNYAYQDAGSYRRLGLMILFAFSPYVALLGLSRLFARSKEASGPFFAVGASLISVAGVAAYFDTAFIHIDAQGGLIFLFLPLLQLVACLVLAVVCALWNWLARSRGATE